MATDPSIVRAFGFDPRTNKLLGRQRRRLVFRGGRVGGPECTYVRSRSFVSVHLLSLLECPEVTQLE
jgi:hypothetical protein